MSDKERNAKAILALVLVIIAGVVVLNSLGLLQFPSSDEDTPYAYSPEQLERLNRQVALIERTSKNVPSQIFTSRNATSTTTFHNGMKSPSVSTPGKTKVQPTARSPVSSPHSPQQNNESKLDSLPFSGAPYGGRPQSEYLSEHDLDLMRKMNPMFASIMQVAMTLVPSLTASQEHPDELLQQVEQHSKKLSSASRDIRMILAAESFDNKELDSTVRKIFSMSATLADKIIALRSPLTSKQFETVEAEVDEIIGMHAGFEEAALELGGVLQKHDPQVEQTLKRKMRLSEAIGSEIGSVISLCEGSLTPASFVEATRADYIILKELAEELTRMSNVGSGSTAEDKEFADTVFRLINDGKVLANLVMDIHSGAEKGEQPTQEQCVAFATRTQELVESTAKYMGAIEGILSEIASRVGK